VATPDGRALYATLGWQIHSLYTTAVIRSDANQRPDPLQTTSVHPLTEPTVAKMVAKPSS
jgi:hypothetical protein